ncbi:MULTISPECIES: antitoxin VbhA family protein [unclassified Rathayibacter]|uniref:antitoxin VbhA family protein n=1 Tax=unclassified Rathayibacter TaxID=2609250 RepID=UPI000FB9058C|nr:MULTISPECIES: antitoxin VbhA family protein [unclassified Rathayibacter]ROP56971.1 hypothetical protein EDF45_0494 [Rathayibacter sp. PhB186]ROS55356.1 hypothetical protein EDF44_0494 [Rathayibacter sp. PhB185]TCL85548.1 hypothetical protein EDF49_101216 [Rathayibacter sp. PhB192]TCM31369.1 hypothetical protein EDF43_101216 [Rathayibacter sp. PhB179]
MVFARVSPGVPTSDAPVVPGRVDLPASIDEIMAEITKGQQLAGHFPSEETLERGRQVLTGERSIEDARRELRAKYAV